MKPKGSGFWRYARYSILFLALSVPVFAQETAPDQPNDTVETGIITGTVYDSQTGNIVRAAAIKTKEEKYATQSDIDGKYVLKLPPGKYTLLVSADGYFDQPIEGVEVESRRKQYIDAIIVPQNLISEEKMVVTADSVQAATVKSAMLERQLAPMILDNISAEDISKNPDSDAAAVLERVIGVSVIDDKFVYVRGLGERYSSTQVNGSMVPSTDPEKKVVAFDLFPASLINKISTLKNFTPDQPGDFSGALVKIETVEFPEEFVLKYSTSLGFNTNVSLQDTLGYPGSPLDWIGFGYNERRLPSIIPDARITRRNDITGTGFTPEELQTFGRAFKDEWESQVYTAAPNMSHSITAGGTKGPFGVIFSLTYSHKNSRVNESLNTFQSLNGNLIPWNTFTNDKNTETVKMGFVGSLSFKLNDSNKLLWKNFYTRDASDETRFLSGYSNGNTADERDTRLRYLQETMWTTQAAGEHYFNFFTNSLLEWRMAYSKSTRGEPDLREVVYRSEEGKNDFSFAPEGQSGFRQFSDQKDRILEPGIDWSLFLLRGGFNATLKFGGLYQRRLRDFESRRFIFHLDDRSIDLRQSPEQLFASENIEPGVIELREITRFSDTFDANQNIYAGYAMVDALLAQNWHLTGGVRYEKSQIRLDTFDPFKPLLEPIVTRLDSKDLLPAASVIYSVRQNMNFRASYSRTLNRPEFREMAPFQFTDISGRSTIIGNPDLKQSKIDNYDFRWEWFPSGEDLYAVSFFSKKFYQPIERVLFYSADLLTSFANSDHADNRGIELEVKKELGFISDRLRNFTIYSNYSRIYSRVSIGDMQGIVMTSLERPLQGQADYIFNANLEYSNPKIRTDFRILYNLVGSRITEVGATHLPDVYEQPNHFLDFAFAHQFNGLYRMKLKFTVENILNRAIRELQGDRLYYGYRIGRTFGVGISYDLH